MPMAIEASAAWEASMARATHANSPMTPGDWSVKEMMKASKEAKDEVERLEAERHASDLELGDSELVELTTCALRRATCPILEPAR